MRPSLFFLFWALCIGQSNAQLQTTASHMVPVEAAIEAEDVSDFRLPSELAELTKVYHNLQEWRGKIEMQANIYTLFEQLKQSFEQANKMPIEIAGTKLRINSDLVVATNAFFLRESSALNAAQGERIESKQALLLLAELWTSDEYRWAVLWSGKELGFALAAHVKNVSSSPDYLSYSCPDNSTLAASSYVLVEQACGALKEWRELVLQRSRSIALSGIKEQFTAALQQVLAFEQLSVSDEQGSSVKPLPKPIALTEIKDKVLRSISYGIKYSEDSMRLKVTEATLQGVIEAGKISTHFQPMRVQLEEMEQLVKQRMDKNFSDYTKVVSELVRLSQSELGIGMTEINQYLSTTSVCGQQIFIKLSSHIQAYRATQQVGSSQWREDFIGMEECAP